MKLLLLLSAGALLVLGFAGSGAFAAPKAACNNGTIGGSTGSINSR